MLERVKVKSIAYLGIKFIKLNNFHSYKTILWIISNSGQKKYYIPNEINIRISSNSITLLSFTKAYYSFCSLYEILIKNSLRGFIRDFKIYLVIKGLGLKITKFDDKFIFFRLGFSHLIKFVIPNSISFFVLPKKMRSLKIMSSDYQLLNEVSSRIKNFKKPNSYKYLGVYTFNQVIKLKVSKKKSV